MSGSPVERDILAPRQRAIDILLGSLGFAEEAELLSVERAPEGYAGVLKFSDGEQISFRSEEPLGELEEWALHILLDELA